MLRFTSAFRPTMTLQLCIVRPSLLQLCALIAATFSASASASALLPAATPVEPLLQKYCVGCHNQTEAEAKLSLQSFESVKRGSEHGSVLNAEKPEAGRLFLVLTPGRDDSMPPADSLQPSEAERAVLRQWVLDGAKMQPLAVSMPKVPDIRPFAEIHDPLLASAAAADGTHVALAGTRQIQMVTLPERRTEWTWKSDSTKVASLQWHEPSSQLMAAVGRPGISGGAVLLSAADGTVVREFGGHTDAVYAAVVNQAGTLAATGGYDRRIVLHDLKSGNVLRTLDGHNGSIFALAFDPSGEVLCSASADGTVKVWRVADGERLDTLSQPQGEQYAVALNPDGQRIYAAGADNRIRIWELLSRKSAVINPQITSRFAHEFPITRLAMSADGNRLATASEDRTVRVWNAFPLRQLGGIPQQPSAVTSLSFVGSSGLLITHIDGTWDVVSVPTDSEKPAGVAESEHPVTSGVSLTGDPGVVKEEGSNDDPSTAPMVTLPVKISGSIQPDGGNDRDADCFQFSAQAGQTLILEVSAARSGSSLDSRLEVLSTDGTPILRTRLQAVRDSYFTFRGKDSDTSDDFRVFNWQEMELNEYLYSDGEVVRLWLYPRGPDSGFKVYPGFGKRFTWFDTTPTAHALQAPCFIVVPRAADEEIVPNGLPTFPVYFENDDDPRREWGSDSRLFFTAPADGTYAARITDARGFAGEKFNYELTIRSPEPGYTVAISSRKISVAPGTGREITFTANRVDGFEGPITIDIQGLPDGFGFSGPLTIQSHQLQAFGTLYAIPGASQPTPEQVSGIRISASADSGGQQELGGLEELTLRPDSKIQFAIVRQLPVADAESETPIAATSDNKLPVLEIHPGQTIRAFLDVTRTQHNGVISFGKEDSGRNLPHGVFVDNI
ncbi:MAG: hypothetical protein KDA89_01965, partial [Planctomycetaceae bacterium]|nr:hypothetical protein [Planctomycetaceae bacterium]